MANAVSTLTSTVTADSLWAVFGNAIPYIAVVILFAFGYRLISKRLLKGLSTGKYKG